MRTWLRVRLVRARLKFERALVKSQKCRKALPAPAFRSERKQAKTARASPRKQGCMNYV